MKFKALKFTLSIIPNYFLRVWGTDRVIYHTKLSASRVQEYRQSNKLYKIECFNFSEMEYCASVASMLAEEFWQIAKGFVEVPVKSVGSN